MALYRCEACNEDRRDPICEKCGRETREIEPASKLVGLAASIVREQAVPPPPRPIRVREDEVARDRAERTRRFIAPQQRAEEPQPAPRARPSPAARPQPAATPPTAIAGLVEFEALIKQRKMSAVVICGDSQTGKSEIAAGFTRARAVYRGKSQILTLRAPNRDQHSLGGTVEGEVWYQVVDDKHVFLDPSGEFFKQLSPQERLKNRLPDVTEEKFEFVKSAVGKLAGIVLVVDLTRTLGADDYTAWKRQEDDLNFVLAALRMLRFDKTARPENITMTVNIAQRVSKLHRLDKPVLVLFSKADQLTHFTNSSPLEFAKANLPLLHSALQTHARHFRYDFCHTMIKTAHGDRAADHPCGVLLSMEWLLNNPFHRLPFQLPTRWLGGGR